MYLEFYKIIIPVITFVLGVICTWWFKEREKRSQRIENSIKDVSQLSTDWYHELYAIKQAFMLKVPEEEIIRRIIVHSQNRTILPKLLQNIEILADSKRCEDLVCAVKALLGIATVSSNGPKRRRLIVERCRPTWNSSQYIEDSLKEIPRHLCNYNIASEAWNSVDIFGPEQLRTTYLEVKLLVALLDEKIQEINKLAGIVLKKL